MYFFTIRTLSMQLVTLFVNSEETRLCAQEDVAIFRFTDTQYLVTLSKRTHFRRTEYFHLIAVVTTSPSSLRPVPKITLRILKQAMNAR